MNYQELPDTIQLIQHSLTSILLDAIQFFPQESKRNIKESHGLLFGNIQNGIFECDYVFPVGNVLRREPDSVRNNPTIDIAIQNAKHLLFTSRCYGDYHSHPNKKSFNEWAYPSNADVLYYKKFKLPCMIIIALSRKSIAEKALEVEYVQCKIKEFHHKRGADDHDIIPIEVELDANINVIKGVFKKYSFELRAYKCENDYLKSINLISSEAEMLMELKKNNLSVENLDSDTSYALRKIEYDFRILGLSTNNSKEKTLQNMQYHIDKLKNS